MRRGMFVMSQTPWREADLKRLDRLWAQHLRLIAKVTPMVRPKTIEQRADDCIRDILAMTCRELQRTGRI